MNLLDTATHAIEIDLDRAHFKAAHDFVTAARTTLQQYNLSRHTLHIKLDPGPGLYVRTGRLATPWWEIGRAPHKQYSVTQAIAEIGNAIDELPEAVQRKLDGVQL